MFWPSSSEGRLFRSERLHPISWLFTLVSFAINIVLNFIRWLANYRLHVFVLVVAWGYSLFEARISPHSIVVSSHNRLLRHVRNLSPYYLHLTSVVLFIVTPLHYLRVLEIPRPEFRLIPLLPRLDPQIERFLMDHNDHLLIIPVQDLPLLLTDIKRPQKPRQ